MRAFPSFSEQILIVDDTLPNLKLLAEILSENGYRVRPVKSGRLALESIAFDPPDLILLDVKMPEMDGYEVCRRLKADEQYRDIPVIFISAHEESTEKSTGFKAGGADFIIKPFLPEEALLKVQFHLQLCRLKSQLKRTQFEQNELYRRVTQDLESPFRQIDELSELMIQKEKNPLDAPLREQLKKIKDAACQMRPLLENLFDLSRAKHTELMRQSVDLSELLPNVIRDLTKDCPNRKIIWNIQPLPKVTAEPWSIRRVLFNLISNALKFSEEREETAITIGVETFGQKGENLVSETAIFIRDNGVGFNPAGTNPHATLFQTHPPPDAFSGAGVGLATVRTIIDRHGERIWMEKKPNEGTVFYFTVTLSQ